MGKKDPELKQIQKLKKQYKKDSKSRLFFPLARLYEKQGDTPSAIAILKEGIDKIPNYYGAKTFLGELFFKMNDFDAAISQLEHVIRYVPDNVTAYKILTKIYQKQGKEDLAKERDKTARLITPDHPSVESADKIIEDVSLNIEEENLDKKINKLQDIPVDNSKEEKEDNDEKIDIENDEIVTATLAELYYSQGSIENAISIYSKLILKEPDQKNYLKRLDELKKETSNEGSAPLPKDIQVPEEMDKVLITLESWLDNINTIKTK